MTLRRFNYLVRHIVLLLSTAMALPLQAHTDPVKDFEQQSSIYRQSAAGFLNAPVSEPSSDDAKTIDSWLDKMSQASRLQNFRGTLIIRQQDKLQAIKVNQGVTPEGSWQTLESLSGEPQKIFRHNDLVTSIFPAKQLVTISGDTGRAPLHPILPNNRRILTKIYQLTLAGEDRIANKNTQIIKMKPFDKNRYGYLFWLDKQSGILLKCDMLDAQGKVLEQLMYSEVELLDKPPVNPLDMQVIAQYRVINLQDASRYTQPAWQAVNLPEGFELKKSVSLAHPDQHMTYHLVYSDGMASVSVFIERQALQGVLQKEGEHSDMPFSPSGKAQTKAQTDESKPLVYNMGPVNAYSAQVNNLNVTAIGEVPASAVKLIAESIQAIP